MIWLSSTCFKHCKSKNSPGKPASNSLLPASSIFPSVLCCIIRVHGRNYSEEKRSIFTIFSPGKQVSYELEVTVLRSHNRLTVGEIKVCFTRSVDILIQLDVQETQNKRRLQRSSLCSCAYVGCDASQTYTIKISNLILMQASFTPHWLAEIERGAASELRECTFVLQGLNEYEHYNTEC